MCSVSCLDGGVPNEIAYTLIQFATSPENGQVKHLLDSAN